MSIGYFNKNTFTTRVRNGFGPAFTLWETTDGKIVPVTVKDDRHNSFTEMEEVGELKEQILKIDIQTAIKAFGETSEDILKSIQGYKNAKELREYLALV